MEYCIQLYKRPGLENQNVEEQVLNITNSLVGEWFTPDVLDGIAKDLLFHDTVCLEINNNIVSFIMFTSLDGAMHILLMGTSPMYRGKGYGSMLIKYLFEHAKALGFCKIDLLTVPPEYKPSYNSTIGFYMRHGFIIEKEYTEIWQSGALKLVKNLGESIE